MPLFSKFDIFTKITLSGLINSMMHKIIKIQPPFLFYSNRIVWIVWPPMCDSHARWVWVGGWGVHFFTIECSDIYLSRDAMTGSILSSLVSASSSSGFFEHNS